MSKESRSERHGIDLPLEGAVGYTMLKVTKVSKVPKVTKVKEFCQFYFYKKDGAKRHHNFRHFSSL